MDPLVLGLGAAALIFLLRKKKTAPAYVEPGIAIDVDDPEIDEPDQPIVEPPPGDPTGLPGNVIGGDPELDFQPKSKYPNYGTVLMALSQLGYVPPVDFMERALDRSLMADSVTREAIEDFQKDYKYVVKYLTEWPQMLHGEPVPKAPREKLGVDGWIGQNTWPGLKWAHGKIWGQGQDWQEWVDAGKGL
jgi:hypothetical protein